MIPLPLRMQVSCPGYLLQHQRDTAIQKRMIAHTQHECQHSTFSQNTTQHSHSQFREWEVVTVHSLHNHYAVTLICHTCHTGVFDGPQLSVGFLWAWLLMWYESTLGDTQHGLGQGLWSWAVVAPSLLTQFPGDFQMDALQCCTEVVITSCVLGLVWWPFLVISALL